MIEKLKPSFNTFVSIFVLGTLSLFFSPKFLTLEM